MHDPPSVPAPAPPLQVGRFNDDHPDAESQAHFALWALYKSPLLIGADIRKVSASSKAILQNAEIIAISQDDLGVPGDLVWQQGPRRIYAAPLADGSRAVVMFNAHHYGSQFPVDNTTLSFDMLGLSLDTEATIRDLYAGAELGSFTGSFVGAVPLHGVLALKVTPTDPARRDTTWRPWHRFGGAPAKAEL